LSRDNLDTSADGIRGDLAVSKEEVKVPEKPATTEKEILDKKEAAKRPEHKREE